MSARYIRAPAVAGMFYPSDPDALRGAVLRLLADAEREQHPPVAMIAPHAGYMYSGPIAASAFAQLERYEPPPLRVAVIGPAHREYVKGVAIPRAGAFATPLGEMPVDQEALAGLAALPQVVVSDSAHAREHCIEVELPFLQVLWDGVALVPVLVGDTTAEAVHEVIEQIWDEQTFVVISSDLSHYLDYDSARRIDLQTTQAIERLAYTELASLQACGSLPIAGLLLSARRRGLRLRAVDVRNSGDTAGERDRVVGYGAYLVEYESDPHPRLQ